MLLKNFYINENESVIVKSVKELEKFEYNYSNREYYYRILLFENSNKITICVDCKELKINRFTVFIIYPEQQFDLKNNKSSNGLFIQFTRDFLGTCIYPSRLHFLLKYYFKTRVVLKQSSFYKLFKYFEQIKECNESVSTLRTDKVQKILGLAFLELLEYKININKNVSKISLKDNISYKFLGLVMQHIDQYRLVKNYAELLNVSIDKLEKEVRSQCGKLPSVIINEFLLSEIKRLLLIGTYTHKEISFMLNFDSPSSYSRFVKKYTGVTPTKLKGKIESKELIL